MRYDETQGLLIVQFCLVKYNDHILVFFIKKDNSLFKHQFHWEHRLSKDPRLSLQYSPFELIYTEEFSDRREAIIREKYWKSGIGREILRLKRSKVDAGLSTDR